jgi:hypothetical protein
VKLTEAEDERLARAAETAGLTVPHLIAETVLAALDNHGNAGLSAADRHLLASELGAVRRYLKSISDNVNRLTAAYHSTGTLAPAQVTATMHAALRGVARLDALLHPMDGGTP